MRYQRKPGDRVVRIHTREHRLSRVLGIPALYSAGYGNVGSSIYYALGVVTMAAMGATPLVMAIAGLFFVFSALSYAEGSAMFPEAGGSATFARHGFNDLIGFIAGWALMLSYIVTIAISAFIIPPYLGYFWAPLKESAVIGTATSMGIIFFLMLLNILGVKETSFVNIMMATLDLLMQLFIVTLGFLFLFNPFVLLNRIVLNWPSPQQLVLGLALATLAYTGVETVSQMAEETRRPAFRVPRALMLMVFTVIVIFSGISLVAFSAMTPGEMVSQWAKDPVAGIAHNLPLQLQQGGREFADPLVNLLYLRFVDVVSHWLPPLVAFLAATILLIATSAGMLGISRLTFSMSRNRLLPAALSHVHHRFKTPYIAIITFTLVALLLLVPGLFSHAFLLQLGALYTFGSLLSWALADASIISLRVRYPQLPRPFKIKPNLKIAGRELPLTAMLGLLISSGIWIAIALTQPFSRWVGLGWMGLGLVFYVLYRWRSRLPLSSSVPPPLRQ